MDSYPPDFSQKAFDELYLKHTETVRLEQNEFCNVFRLDLYKKVKDAYHSIGGNKGGISVTFSFPDILDHESKMALLEEIMSKFPDVRYFNNKYIGPGYEKLTTSNMTDHGYAYMIMMKVGKS